MGFYYFCICMFVFLEVASASAETTTEIITTEIPTVTTLDPLLPTTFEKLVRYRRQPPVTIIKHVIRSSKRSKPRRRVKRPKIKYGPPNFNYGEPISYYKTQSSSHSYEQPSFAFDELKNLKFDESEFDFPPSSYEAQAMDVDFYSHGDSSYESPKLPSIDYTIESEPEKPTYTYKSNSYKETPRIPHEQYGVPKDHEYSTNFKNSEPSSSYHPSLGSVNYESTKYSSGSDNTYGSPPAYENSYQSHSPYQVPPAKTNPSTKYGPPPPSVDLTSSHTADQAEYYAGNNKGNYKMYEKKLPNSGFKPVQHSFAEPPSKTTEIEITYSPSYEITIPPTNYRKPDNNYNHKTGNFAEPPLHPPEYTPSHSSEFHPEYTAVHPNDNKPEYKPPPPPPPPVHPPEYTPVHSSEHHPGNTPDHPSSEYPQDPPEPSYDSPSFPVQYNNAEPSHSQTYPQESYVPPSQELPLNPNHKQPPYDFPKSSYEVPLYDPIPFDASNTDQQEYYPPHPYDILQDNANNYHPNIGSESRDENIYVPQNNIDMQKPSSDEPRDAHTSSTSISSTAGEPDFNKRPRKRKRVRGSSTITPLKHILDVPELEEAFEAGKRKHLLNHNLDAEPEESNQVEKKRNYLSSTKKPTSATEHFVSQAWNPMRIQSSTRILPPMQYSTTTVKPYLTDYKKQRQRHQQKYRNSFSNSQYSSSTNSAKTTEAVQNMKNIAILSVEKSRSHSYYDGTLPPPTTQSLPSSQNTRPTRFRMPTKLSSQMDKQFLSKQTTKSVLNTTHFKSPRNDRETYSKQLLLQQNLPKNHKLF